MLGPETAPSGRERFPEGLVDGVAAEPGTTDAWLALDTKSHAKNHTATQALVARIAADGTVSDEASLPGAGDPHGPLGAAEQIVCPAIHDCWMATEKRLARAPRDGSRTRQPPKTPMLRSQAKNRSRSARRTKASRRNPRMRSPSTTRGSKNRDPQLEDLAAARPGARRGSPRSPCRCSRICARRLIDGTTLELSFHLAVKARVRLLAKRRRKVVASTATRDAEGRQPQAAPAPGPAPLADEAEPADARARAAAHHLARGNPRRTSVSTSLRFPNDRLRDDIGLLP